MDYREIEERHGSAGASPSAGLGATKHPECTPDLSIHFEGTLALAA